MLTDDLRNTLREHADDIDAVPATVLAGVERKQELHHRRRFAAAAGCVVLATVAVTVGVLLLVNNAGAPKRHTVSVDGSGSVPCAEPARHVPNFVDWPCPTRAVTDYERQEFDHMRQIDGLIRGNFAPGDLDFRVLAFGSVPHSRASSSFVFAEVWRRDGNTPPQFFLSYASLDTLYTLYPLPRPATGAPLPQLDGGGLIPAGDPAMVVAAPLRYPRHTTLKACNRWVQRPPTRRSGYVNSCTDMVLVRAGITAIRVVQPNGQTDAPIPVNNGIASLDRFARSRQGWSIQGLDTDGNVVSSVPYRATM